MYVKVLRSSQFGEPSETHTNYYMYIN